MDGKRDGCRKRRESYEIGKEKGERMRDIEKVIKRERGEVA